MILKVTNTTVIPFYDLDLELKMIHVFFHFTPYNVKITKTNSHLYKVKPLPYINVLHVTLTSQYTTISNQSKNIYQTVETRINGLINTELKLNYLVITENSVQN